MNTKDTIIKAHYTTFSLTSKCVATWKHNFFQIQLKPTTENIHPKKFEEFVLYFTNSKLHSLQFQSIENEDFFNLSGSLKFQTTDKEPQLVFEAHKNTELTRFQGTFLKNNTAERTH